MAEPITSTATSVSAWSFGKWAFGIGKIISPAVLGAVIASTIVFLMTMPRTRSQQFIALLVTFSASIYGGAAVIDYFHLDAVFSTVSKGGIFLLCGLPAWVILRGFFAYTERDKSKGLLEYVKEIRQAWKGGQ
jgi:hypothetical protein